VAQSENMLCWLAETGSGRIDVDKSAYHQLSQNEIGGDNPCSQQLSSKRQEWIPKAVLFEISPDDFNHVFCGFLG
jgi:hypothetical protein